MRALLASLLAHQHWADAATADGLGAAGSPGKAHERLMHVFAAEHVWLSRIQGVPSRWPVWPPFTAEGCRELLAGNQRGFAELLAGDDAALARQVTYQTTDGRTFTNTVADILAHMVLHGSWHRGQIALLVREAGGQPVASDYIAFVRGAPAAVTRR